MSICLDKGNQNIGLAVPDGLLITLHDAIQMREPSPTGHIPDYQPPRAPDRYTFPVWYVLYLSRANFVLKCTRAYSWTCSHSFQYLTSLQPMGSGRSKGSELHRHRALWSTDRPGLRETDIWQPGWQTGLGKR